MQQVSIFSVASKKKERTLEMGLIWDVSAAFSPPMWCIFEDPAELRT